MTTSSVDVSRREHLIRANLSRANVAHLRHELLELDRVASAHRLADLLDDQDQTVMRMRAQSMLLSVRGIGPVKARLILRGADITIGMTRVGQVSGRQRAMIAELLRGVR